MKSAGSVNEQVVGAFAQGRVDGVMGNGSRVCAVFTADHRNIEPVAPKVQLFDCCRAKGVAGGEHRVGSLGLYPVCQLGCRGRFACPIYADQ